MGICFKRESLSLRKAFAEVQGTTEGRHSLTVFEPSFSSGFLLSFSHPAFSIWWKTTKLFRVHYFLLELPRRTRFLLGLQDWFYTVVISLVTICSGHAVFSCQGRRAGPLVACHPLDSVSPNDFKHSWTVTFRSSERTGATLRLLWFSS